MLTTSIFAARYYLAKAKEQQDNSLCIDLDKVKKSSAPCCEALEVEKSPTGVAHRAVRQVQSQRQTHVAYKGHTQILKEDTADIN